MCPCRRRLWVLGKHLKCTRVHPWGFSKFLLPISSYRFPDWRFGATGLPWRLSKHPTMCMNAKWKTSQHCERKKEQLISLDVMGADIIWYTSFPLHACPTYNLDFSCFLQDLYTFAEALTQSTTRVGLRSRWTGPFPLRTWHRSSGTLPIIRRDAQFCRKPVRHDL